MDLDAAAKQAQLLVQRLQRLVHKFKMLQGRIGLQPNFRLHHIDTAHRALLRRRGKGSMVLPAQVTFKPNQRIAHVPVDYWSKSSLGLRP